jgi:hypothetical protein
VSDGRRHEKVVDVRQARARDAGRAKGGHEDGLVARSWPQHIFGSAVPCVMVIGLGTVHGIMMYPNSAGGW